MRTIGNIDSWWLDIKLGIRMLIKYPGLALAGGAGIAVAVAISAGMYSFIYTNVLVTSSLPVEEGERIVSIEIWDTAAGRPERRSLYDYHVWREGLKSVQEISAFRVIAPNLIVPGVRPENVFVAAMSASGFRLARVRPLMGRYIEEGDEREGAPSVIVIGEDVWRNRFASDPAILGRTIQLGATSYSIIGVMPKGYAFPVNHHFWIPLRAGLPLAEPRTGPDLMVFGRLAPGATIESAQAELATISQRTTMAFPKAYAQLRPQVLPYAQPFVGLHGSQDVFGLLAMQGLLVSLLVLVSLNVAILVYTRTAMRRAEIGLRTALGASRGRIVTQLFVEALVLSVVAALAGVAIAALGLRQIEAALGDIVSTLPFWITFRLSLDAVLYAVALGVFAAVIVGIAPAIQATRRGLQNSLRIAGAEGLRLGKTWTVLIIAQVAFAVAILPPAVASAWQDAMDGIIGVGFAADEFLSAQLGMDSAPDRFAARQTELMRRLEDEPRVSGVTFALFNPGDEGGAEIEVEGGAQVREGHFNRVDVNFFRVFEVPVLGGRTFGPGDIDGGTVVVNQPFAQEILGGDALGRRIRYVKRTRDSAPQTAESERWYEVVGIVSDFPTGASQGMRNPNRAKVYHAIGPGHPANIAIRMREGAPSTFTPRLQEIALAVDPDLDLRNIRSLEEVLRSEQWISRMTAAAFVCITLTVLMLSSAGVYSLMAFTVSQRRKEIGIRIALGADRKRIVTNIFSRAFLQLAAGAAFGAALVIWWEKGSGGVIMRGHAAVALPGVALVIIVVGFLATLGPARRSLRIEPTEALREE
jgi:putative ABC transport system permease protein